MRLAEIKRMKLLFVMATCQQMKRGKTCAKVTEPGKRIQNGRTTCRRDYAV